MQGFFGTAMQDLKISIIQSDIHWEDIGANLAMFEEKIWKIGQTDVIVLPEMFTTGFTMRAPKLAEHMNMRTFKWMKQMADQTGALVLGSFIALVCYDLRFPVWSRNRWNATLKKMSYDVLVYVANWPQVRAAAWKTLLDARAIENLSFVVGVNRVGTDGNGVEYNGNSAVIGPKGDPIFQVEGEEAIKTVELNAHSLQAFRDRFPAYLDADDFSIEFEQFQDDHLSGLS